VTIVITGFGSIETRCRSDESMALSITSRSPFKLDELKLCVQRALNYNDVALRKRLLKKQLGKQISFNQMIGTSPKMQDVRNMIEKVADTDSTILILGESGTGKELVARALHFNSRRRNAPFVPLNCSALPENLLESELFGHRKGSFTGAVADKKGLFQEAMAARFSSTKSAPCRRCCRAASSASSRKRKSAASVTTPRSTSTSASSPPPTNR
jgi:DNA-binding NtrC family response regulator